MNSNAAFFSSGSLLLALGAGVLQWGVAANVLAADSPLVLRFNGGFHDAADSIATDALGNAYVGGEIENVERKREFAVVKYDSAGVLQWKAAYPSALHDVIGGRVRSVVVDAAGNVYAAGQVYTIVTPSTINMDWLVVSYSPDGVERWSHRVDGAANAWDTAASIRVNAAGAVYVSGVINDVSASQPVSWTVIKYSPVGTLLWRRTDVRTDGTYDGFGNLHFDAAGNLLGVGHNETVQFNAQHKIVTTKLDPNGNVLWRRLFSDTPQSDDVVADVDVDANGNVYVTGVTVPGTSPELDHVPITLKYTAGGTLERILRGDGAGGSSVAVDSFGDVVVSGTSMREAGAVGLSATAKYDGTGQRKWLTSGVAGEISIDATGNVFSFETEHLFSSNQSDLRTVKLNPDGTLAWEHRYDGKSTLTMASSDRTVASTVDPFGNFVAVGNAQEGIDADFVTLLYAANVVPPTPPVSVAAPSNLLASGGSGRVFLSWRDNADNEGAFSIERCMGKNCANFSPIAQVGGNVASFIDTGLSSRTTYRYRVRAARDAVASAYSNIATATTLKK